jgi:hypothetical protein
MPVNRISRTARLIAGATSTLRQRIFAKIVRLPGRNACWQWTGGTARKRDGAKRPKIQVGGRGSRTILVARVLLCLRDGVPLAERDAAKLEAGHVCHRHWCVNPRHLEWQTRIENEHAKQEYDDYCDFAQTVDELAEEEAAA